jgi:hypothetical protein
MRKLLAPLALLALAVAIAAAGCGSPCQDLADHICNCQPQGALQDSCKTSVKTQLGSQNPSKSDENFCQDRLRHCKDPSEDSTLCDRLQTVQGKIDCGLAFADAGT